jgi:hypothetical protein
METVNLKDQQLRVRNTSTPTWLRRLSFPAYWKWGKFAGAVGLVVLAILWAINRVPHPAVVAILLHIAGDFTLQSPETARRKHERGRHLLVHALAAGGFPLAVAGFATGNPITVLIWTPIGVISHYIVDWTRRFGMEGKPRGVFFDQACHLLTILVLVLIV